MNDLTLNGVTSLNTTTSVSSLEGEVSLVDIDDNDRMNHLERMCEKRSSTQKRKSFGLLVKARARKV